ncbi:MULTISPECIES: FAD-binding domain-containing protein [Trichocoleus]|uniref:Deoxyribodipyrimidine photo-lyase n=1 Tax=Trichocoleus desertorum GB2-A4 TaxID=2933944 RepID=A0ABV0J3F6_9CYAN|nr:FAD-binding domain-containing protein [Trichocoleus sp. FACHB-46]MBD1861642.1 deoxyribodipyrimidine photo-lyase [Trichocoleus sp. FACHB-46]
MSDLILFWHRRDLRITDNIGLAQARQQSPKVVGVFCLDPLILERNDVAPARVTYMIGSLRELQASYAQAGSELLILRADPRTGIPALAAALNAQAVFWNWDIEPYARQRDRAVLEALHEKGIKASNFWDQLLHAPEDIRSGSGNPYTVYTPFWRNWSSRLKAEPVERFQGAVGLTSEEKAASQQVGAIALPTAKDLGFVWENELVLTPGETAAQERLEGFCDRALSDYAEQRNFPSEDGTSQLSAALKFGVLGVRHVWAATTAVMEQVRSDEARDGVQTWRQELAWREFYQHVLYFFPALADGPYRQPLKDFPWQNNDDHLQAWCEGRTGYPIVDAAIRQMNETGWMHNRCRMIVASFLVKDLIINWQEGEKYFMQKLFDGDLSANNGGWQWSASSGMDPKPLRIFNPASQAKKFDPDAAYIRHWLPELRSVDTEDLLSGKILPLERDRCGYPAPIVDHNKQQSLFKQLYQQQKAGLGVEA